MPVANNPDLPDYYVYVLLAEGHPFYVGVGRAGRKDRVQWVRSQIKKELMGQKGKWVCHTRVMRELFALGIWVDTRLRLTGVNKADAHTYERKLIHRLKKKDKDIKLANVHHNADSKATVEGIVADLVRRVVRDRLKLRPT